MQGKISNLGLNQVKLFKESELPLVESAKRSSLSKDTWRDSVRTTPYMTVMETTAAPSGIPELLLHGCRRPCSHRDILFEAAKRSYDDTENLKLHIRTDINGSVSAR